MANKTIEYTEQDPDTGESKHYQVTIGRANILMGIRRTQARAEIVDAIQKSTDPAMRWAMWELYPNFVGGLVQPGENIPWDESQAAPLKVEEYLALPGEFAQAVNAEILLRNPAWIVRVTPQEQTQEDEKKASNSEIAS